MRFLLLLQICSQEYTNIYHSVNFKNKFDININLPQENEAFQTILFLGYHLQKYFPRLFFHFCLDFGLLFHFAPSEGAKAEGGLNELIQEVSHHQGVWYNCLDHPPCLDKSQNSVFFEIINHFDFAGSQETFLSP